VGVAGSRIFDHASIPATVTDLFVPTFDQDPANTRSVREKQSQRFIDLITLDQMRNDTPDFVLI
jgi:hypothetical protein